MKGALHWLPRQVWILMLIFSFSEIGSLRRSCVCVYVNEALERERSVEGLADMAWRLQHASSLTVNVHKPTLLAG